MKPFMTSFALAVCLAATGCSSKIPQSAAHECRNEGCAAVAVTPTKPAAPILFIYDHTTDLPPPTALRAGTRRRKAPRFPEDGYILVASSQNVSATSPGNETMDDSEDTNVRVVSKEPVDELPCADAKHGHPAYLRSDLAYSVTGFDCQGDSAAE